MKELDIIEYIHGLSNQKHESLLQGIGDDCAVVQASLDTVWLMTMDTLIENVHFNRSWHPPELLGRKTVSVNISDIAAMGGRSKFILLSAGLPRSFDTGWFKDFSTGLSKACQEYGCILIGGDTVRCPEGYSFTVVAIGEAPPEEVIYRHGAQIGDDIWVTGQLGSAAAALELYRNFTDSFVNQFRDQFHQELLAHLDPCARTRIGRSLAKEKIASAMMDVSDGLATDLSHIAKASKVHVQLFEDLIPIGSHVDQISKMVNKTTTELALFGGEDYELVFTAGVNKRELIRSVAEAENKIKISRIGKIIEGEGVTLVGKKGTKNIRDKGYDHFV